MAAAFPDLVWISKDGLTMGVDRGHLTVAPEIVQEYWIVNWRLKTLDIYRRHNAQLQRVNTLLDGDILSSPLLPGLSIAIADIFQ
ncbi:MAG: Uma2 family endonuclease [bacterium]